MIVSNLKSGAKDGLLDHNNSKPRLETRLVDID